MRREIGRHKLFTKQFVNSVTKTSNTSTYLEETGTERWLVVLKYSTADKCQLCLRGADK